MGIMRSAQAALIDPRTARRLSQTINRTELTPTNSRQAPIAPIVHSDLTVFVNKTGSKLQRGYIVWADGRDSKGRLQAKKFTSTAIDNEYIQWVVVLEKGKEIPIDGEFLASRLSQRPGIVAVESGTPAIGAKIGAAADKFKGVIGNDGFSITSLTRYDIASSEVEAGFFKGAGIRYGFTVLGEFGSQADSSSGELIDGKYFSPIYSLPDVLTVRPGETISFLPITAGGGNNCILTFYADPGQVSPFYVDGGGFGGVELVDPDGNFLSGIGSPQQLINTQRMAVTASIIGVSRNGQPIECITPVGGTWARTLDFSSSVDVGGIRIYVGLMANTARGVFAYRCQKCMYAYNVSD